jgi:hypothetical protein
MPTAREVEDAQKKFVKERPRNLFYRSAMALLDLSRKPQPKVSVAEALSVLLETWNASFYRFRKNRRDQQRPFDDKDVLDIGALVRANSALIENCRKRTIASLTEDQGRDLRKLFRSFEKVLGAVGAAKCLHLLAPTFFPLWDTKIARAYHVKLGPQGYISVMHAAKEQCAALSKSNGAPWPNALKALDEWNYWTFVLTPTK